MLLPYPGGPISRPSHPWPVDLGDMPAFTTQGLKQATNSRQLVSQGQQASLAVLSISAFGFRPTQTEHPTWTNRKCE